MYFLDGESADWTEWYLDGYIPLNYVVGVNGLIYYGDAGYYESAISSAIERTIYPDPDSPYVEDLDPDDGETDVNLNKSIKGHIVDDNWGIDEDTISVDATVFGRDDIAGDLSLTGDFFDFTYTLNPDDDLPHYAEVFVYVAADDLASNEVEYEYSFWTRSFELQEPDDGDVIDVTGPGRGGKAGRVATMGTVPVIANGDGRTGVDVTFEWEEVVRAESYELIVDDNDDFSSPEVDETDIPENTYTHTFDVTDDVTYYWYVVCNAPDADFDSEEVFSFSFDYNTNVTPASLGHIKAGFAE
jgi:hypothetical protein